MGPPVIVLLVTIAFLFGCGLGGSLDLARRERRADEDLMSDGRYLRRRRPGEPGHACILPHKSLPWDVWMCAGCHRMYVWSDGRGYGFEWQRVWVRYWWFRLVAAQMES